jgi:hypothetical protein
LADYPAYTGLDISPLAVARCREIFQKDLRKRFLLYKPCSFDPADTFNRAELALSLDVIFHLVEEEIFDSYMNHLFDSAEKYVVIYSSNRTDIESAPHVKHRRFTDWIEKNRPDWELFSFKKNDYVFDPERPEETSFSDFYFYVKKPRPGRLWANSDCKPLVSVVMPVYNGADYLGRAIESVQAQSYRNFEILVIDDGSDDGGATENVARAFGDQVRYLRKENGGVASALNHGIRKMQGEYFSWLSHDDMYAPDKLLDQVCYLERLGDPDTVVFSAVRLVDEQGLPLGDPEISPEKLGNLFLTVLSTSVNGCSLLVPRSAFEKVGVFDENLLTVQDNDMWLRMAAAGIPFAYLPRRHVLSRIHDGQGSIRLRDRHMEEKDLFYIKAIRKLGPEVLAFHGQLRKVLVDKGASNALRLLEGIVAAHRARS